MRIILLVQRLWLVGVIGAVLASAGHLRAVDEQIPDCGTVTKMLEGHQRFSPGGIPLKKVQGIAETRMQNSANPCMIQTRTAISVAGQNAWTTGFLNTVSSQNRIVDVPNWGTYNVDSDHAYRISPLGSTVPLAPSAVQVELEVGPDGEVGCGEEYEVQECIGDSPLVVDLSGDGFDFTSAADGVVFDLNGDGIPDDTAWTTAEGDDAFLARDRNRNGVIDNGTELFGNHTPITLNTAGPTSSNGFEALKFFEHSLNGAVYGDNRVGNGDPGFSELLLWHDANHNGYSETWELRPAVEAGLIDIEAFGYRESRRRDRHGNQLRQLGFSHWMIGAHERQRKVTDVWFITR